MTADASWQLQKAFHAALAADAGLTALVTGVFDSVPEGQPFPYLVIGEDRVRARSSKSFEGAEHELAFHAWSRLDDAGAGGLGRRQVKEILAALWSALQGPWPAPEGHALVNLSFLSSETRREPDGLTWHGIARYRAVTEKL